MTVKMRSPVGPHRLRFGLVGQMEKVAIAPINTPEASGLGGDRRPIFATIST